MRYSDRISVSGIHLSIRGRAAVLCWVAVFRYRRARQPHQFAGPYPSHLRSRRIVPQPGFHGPQWPLDSPRHHSAAHRHAHAYRDSRRNANSAAGGECAQAALCNRGLPHNGGHFRDALERRYRRPALLEKPARLHDLESALRFERRAGNRDRSHDHAARNSVCTGKAATALDIGSAS